MVDQVLTDRVVPVHLKRDLELGAHAVDAGNHDRLFVFADVEREEAAEAADLAHDFGAVGAGQQVWKRPFD
jgi:hypothetical protein